MLIFCLVFTCHANLVSEILSTHSECTENHKHFKGETLGYITPWNEMGYKYVLKYPSKFNYISPVWHEFSLYSSLGESDFSVTGDSDIDFLSSLPSSIRLVPRLILTKTHPRNYLKLLENDAFLIYVTKGLVTYAKSHKYQGFVFELWLQGLSVIQSFQNNLELRALHLRMLCKISKEFRKNGLISIITLPPMRSNEIKSQEFLQLIENFDKVNLMTYDFSANTPGPNAPLQWISETIESLVQSNDIDYSKILLGIPFYGYDYQSGHGKPVIGKDFIDILSKNPKDVWDDNAKEHKFLYKNEGKNCVVYFPTIDMIKKRLEFAEKNQMGIGIWELGQGLEYFFNLI